MSKPNLYNMKDLNTGETWERLSSYEMAEIIDVSPVTIRKHTAEGAFRHYVFTCVYEEKRRPPEKALSGLLHEWDRFVPKLHERIIKRGDEPNAIYR